MNRNCFLKPNKTYRFYTHMGINKYPRDVLFHVIFFFLTFKNYFNTKLCMGQTTSIRVGVVLDTDDYVGQMGINCISMALSDFYAANGHYKTRLILDNRDSKGSVVGAAAADLDLLKNAEVRAIIGPLFSVQTNFMIYLGDKAQVPIITFSATSPSLSSIRSPYFIRATLNDSSQVRAISAIIQAFGWREVVLIYEDNDFGEGIVPHLTDALERESVLVPYRSVVPSLATDDQIVAELYKLMTMQTRVFVVHMLTVLGSRLFAKARELGMMSEDYVWIVTDGMTNELNSMDSSVLESMQGVIGVQPYYPKTNEFDNFSIRYKKKVQLDNPKELTPELNIFGLWAYDSTIALAMAAEKAKMTNSRFLEANISRNSTDLEALGMLRDGPNLIQALSRTTFNGLTGKFELVDGQLQSPPYQLVNVVGPAVRVVGYWTKENGIVRELNSINSKANTYSTSKSNLGSIFWPGDKTSPPKGWVVPTNGNKLKIGVPVRLGFTEFVRVTWNPDNSTEVEGYCIDVFKAVMKALHYGVPYEFVPFATSDHKMAGGYNDLAYQVYLGEYDSVVGDMTILANRSQYVDFTLPYIASGVSMVVPIKVDKGKNAWVFLKPLTWELWLTSFCSFVFIGFLIWILEHRINEDFRGPPWYQVGMIFWFSFSTMVFAHKERVISNLARFVLIIWFLVVLILTQSYTASLASMLTVQKLQPTVPDVNTLLKSKDSVGYMNGSFIHGLLRQMNFDESRLKPFTSPEQIDELFSNGSIVATFLEIPYIKLFFSKYCSKYTMVDPTYKADGFGFVFPIGSPLVRDVSRAILNVTEGQTMVDIERKWFGDMTNCRDSNTLESARSLGLESFWGLFLIEGIAAISALIIYVIRFLHEHRHIIKHDDPDSTIWSKMFELLHRFDNKDLKSHTFKNIIQREGDNDFRQSPSNFSLPSPRTYGPPSPICSSPTELNISFPLERSPRENGIENLEGGESQTTSLEIEIANLNENQQLTSTSARTIH